MRSKTTRDGWTTNGRHGIGAAWSKTFQVRPRVYAQIRKLQNYERKYYFRLLGNIPGRFDNQFHLTLRAAKQKAEELYHDFLFSRQSPGD